MIPSKSFLNIQKLGDFQHEVERTGNSVESQRGGVGSPKNRGAACGRKVIRGVERR